MRITVGLYIAAVAVTGLVVLVMGRALAAPSVKSIQPSDQAKTALKHFADLHVINRYEPSDYDQRTGRRIVRARCVDYSPDELGRPGKGRFLIEFCQLVNDVVPGTR